jgi:outer membrane receptor protein involved in Fe transport
MVMKGNVIVALGAGLLLWLAPVFTLAQAGISGRIADETHQPVSYANVLLLSATDSSLVKGAFSEDDGSFSINAIGSGNYRIKVMMVGYADHDSDIFTVQSGGGVRDFGEIVLHEDAVLMDEVQVVAKKALFEQKIDRMVVNVASSITLSGTNVLDVLERSPGVLVNRQSKTISVSGKRGVVVMINGRINYMPAEAVTQLLEGMSSDNVEKIEILTTPPAGLDAEGNAGYINIVLKANIGDGFNGGYSAGAGYGKGAVGNASLNFNYRRGKSNLYGDYSYLHEAQEQVFDFYRSIMLDGAQVETRTISDRFPVRNNHMARLGLDYQVNDKCIVGGLVSGYNTKWDMDATNVANLSSDGVLDSVITVENTELNQWKNLGGNVNLQYTFAPGKKLTMDGDYLWYLDNNPTDYNNHYEDGEGNFLFENYTRSTKMTPINIKVGKMDYTTPIGANIKMETGVKATFSNFTNDVGVEYSNDGQAWVEDPELTAKYTLDEQIAAAYVSLEAPIDAKTDIKAGLRYEFTSSNLGSEEEQDIVDRQFGVLFPTFYLSRRLSENNTINLNYSKRITRPTFNDMAPFVIFLDPYTFFSGNPAVQPAISNNFELGYTYKTFLVSLKYGIEDSTIANFQSTIIEGTNKQLLYTENLKQMKVLSLTLSIPVTPVKWWNMYYNISGVLQEAKKYDEFGLQTYESGNFNIYTSQTFTLPKSFTLELTGMYVSGGLFGIFQLKPFGSVNLGLQKKFGDNGGTLRLGMDNIFNTMNYRDELNLVEQQEYYEAELQFTQPTIKLTYSRNFGNQKVKGARERATGAEEERKRINN